MSDNTDYAKEVVRSNHFSQEHLNRRIRYAKMFKSFLDSADEINAAVIDINENKLYWPHKNWKEFARIECGWTDDRLYQVLRAGRTVHALPEEIRPLVKNERQARALGNIPEDKQPEVLDEAIRFHAKGGKLTAKSIDEAAVHVVGNGERDKAGVPIPDAVMPNWERRQGILDLLHHISSAKCIMDRISEHDKFYHRLGFLGTIKRELGELESHYNQVKGVLPDYVCGYCNGVSPKMESRRGCMGIGLLSTDLHKRLPPEKKQHVIDEPF
jgi:hypothetical protein